MEYIVLQALVFFYLIFRSFIGENRAPYFPIAILLILFSGLRYNVGVDYHSYLSMFERILYWNSKKEDLGLVVICEIAKFLGGTPQMVFLFLSSITITLFFLFIKKNSLNRDVSWIIFISFGTFFLGSLNLVSQYVAIAIFAYSINFIKEKKVVFYIIGITIASLFHLSAVVLLPMYFLRLKLKIKHYLGLIAIFVFLLNSIEYLISFTKYAIYLDPRWAKTMNNDRSFILTAIFILLSLLVVLSRRKIENIKDNHIFVNMAFVSLILILGSLIAPYIPNMFFYRINNYFMIGYLIVIPMYIRVGGVLDKLFFFLIILFMYSYYMFTIFSRGEKYNLTPYNFNLELFL